MFCWRRTTPIPARPPGNEFTGTPSGTCWMDWTSPQPIWRSDWMRNKFPLYPILFSIFPVLSLAGYNIDEISLDVIWRPLLTSLLIGALLFGFAKLIFRDWGRAALAVSLILF